MKEILIKKDAKKDFKDHGFKLITVKVGNRHTLFKYRCLKCGTIHKSDYYDWQRSNKTCYRCYDKPSIQTLETVYVSFKLRGYELLNEIYEGVTQKLTYISPEGELGTTTWNIWRDAWKTEKGFVHKSIINNSQRGVNAVGYVQFDYEGAKAHLAERDFELLSDTYVNSMAPIEVKCPEGHTFMTTMHRYRDYNVRNADKGGFQCPVCKENTKKSLKNIKVFTTRQRSGQLTLFDDFDSFVTKQRISRALEGSKEQIQEVLWEALSRDLGV